MRTREEIISEINRQRGKLKCLELNKQEKRATEVRQFIYGLSWALGEDLITNEEQKYIYNDVQHSEILLLQSQLEGANNMKKVLQNVLDAYKNAYQDLKTKYEELKNSIDKKYYDTDKLKALKEQQFIITPRCNCKRMLNAMCGVSNLFILPDTYTLTPYREAKKQFTIVLSDSFVCLTQGDVIRVQLNTPFYHVETGRLKDATGTVLVIEDDGDREVIIKREAIKRLYNYSRKE